MTAILQDHLPFAPWMQAASARMPGVQPVTMSDWLQVDETYSAQLAEKARLLEARAPEVLALSKSAEPAAQELLALVLAQLQARPGFKVKTDHVIRPDGQSIPLHRDSPLEVLAALVQEDFAILLKEGGEHVLRGALICFPASWSLSEKLGRPLSTIHDPVDIYSGDMARRVQRLFDAARPGQPLMRANALIYVEPELFQPRPYGQAKPAQPGDPVYMRSERQVILRLPKTNAVVFSIHTYVVAWANLTEAQRDGWRASAGAFDR
ncbi:DUF3445 domain-containing protein [Cognatishimia sp. MH4019]|uniref:heme-dependent oxidative N-demethylase family protein n=1 Tax=Cognatishimia sp. MH4019 TaxID=2854030 RepID=UPI001CD1B5F9|nr:DUF3445 domain-containing protein [Cognatishimia sp. MH4019]